MLHTNILSHSREKVDFNGVAFLVSAVTLDSLVWAEFYQSQALQVKN